MARYLQMNDSNNLIFHNAKIISQAIKLIRNIGSVIFIYSCTVGPKA